MNPIAKPSGESRDSTDDDVQDALAQLVLAAREDEAFRRQILLVLDLPRPQRESMVRSAVDAMRINGEPTALRTAFLALATQRGAEAAARLIR
jgi:hypothetical protein